MESLSIASSSAIDYRGASITQLRLWLRLFHDCRERVPFVQRLRSEFRWWLFWCLGATRSYLFTFIRIITFPNIFILLLGNIHDELPNNSSVRKWKLVADSDWLMNVVFEFNDYRYLQFIAPRVLNIYWLLSLGHNDFIFQLRFIRQFKCNFVNHLRNVLVMHSIIWLDEAHPLVTKMFP